MADLIEKQKPTCLEVRIMWASHGYQLNYHQMCIFYFLQKTKPSPKCIFSFSTRKTKDTEKKGIYYEYVFMYSV